MDISNESDSLTAETERLRIQFLDCELDLTETLLELARFERKEGNVSEGIEHATKAAQTVRKFSGLITSPADRDRILARLEKLEAQLPLAQT